MRVVQRKYIEKFIQYGSVFVRFDEKNRIILYTLFSDADGKVPQIVGSEGNSGKVCLKINMIQINFSQG